MTPEQRAALTAKDYSDCSLIMLDQPECWQSQTKSEEQLQELRDRGLWLSQLQRMSLDDKITYSIKIIEQALKQLPKEKWAISFSGGKDSSILSHLMVETLNLDIPHVMSNTRQEYPDVIRVASRRFAALRARGILAEYALPDVQPGDLWVDGGIPLWGKEASTKFIQFSRTGNPNHLKQVSPFLQEQFHKALAAGIKVTDRCCGFLKKKPLKKWDRAHGIKGHFTGVRASESQARRLAAIQRGFLYDSTRNSQWISNPLGCWVEADVWDYLDRFDMRKLFPMGKTGSGCIGCLYGFHLVGEEPNAMQMLWVTDRRRWAIAKDDWGYGEAARVLDIPLVPSEAQIELIRQRFRDGESSDSDELT